MTTTVIETPQSVRELHAAFERFSEAGARLESRYHALQRETEELRTRIKVQDEVMKRSERLSTLGQMAAALAHEVRNPLGAMKLFLSLLRQDVSDRPQAAEMVQHLGTSVETLDTLVANILQFSRDTKLQLVPVNLQMVLEEQVAYCERIHGAAGILRVEFGGNPFIRGHDGSLRQVFYNLLTNSLQALQRVGTPHPLVTVRTKSRANALELVIEDNGPGIPLELQERLFEPFVTSRNEGTGLGLSVVKQIVERHHGTIRAENIQNGGARFVIELPQECGGRAA
jgi:two-component system sensor histidine kinase FlrB